MIKYTFVIKPIDEKGNEKISQYIIDFCAMYKDELIQLQEMVASNPHVKTIPEWYEKYKDINPDVRKKWEYLIDFVKTKDKKWQDFLLKQTLTTY